MSDGSVSAQNEVYEAFVVMGKLGDAILHCLPGRKCRQLHPSKLPYTWLSRNLPPPHPMENTQIKVAFFSGASLRPVACQMAKLAQIKVQK